MCACSRAVGAGAFGPALSLRPARERDSRREPSGDCPTLSVTHCVPHCRAVTAHCQCQLSVSPVRVSVTRLSTDGPAKRGTIMKLENNSSCVGFQTRTSGPAGATRGRAHPIAAPRASVSTASAAGHYVRTSDLGVLGLLETVRPSDRPRAPRARGVKRMIAVHGILSRTLAPAGPTQPPRWVGGGRGGSIRVQRGTSSGLVASALPPCWRVTRGSAAARCCSRQPAWSGCL